MQITRCLWYVGDQTKSKLLGRDGKRCCLGFLGKYLGATNSSIEFYSAPSANKTACEWPTVLFTKNDNLICDPGKTIEYNSITNSDSDWESVLIRINDSKGIDNEIRENWIAAGFKILFDIDVEFVGEY